MSAFESSDLIAAYISLSLSANDKRGEMRCRHFDVHDLLMICLAFAAVTQHSAPPIDMVMHYMFMLTYIFSFQRGYNKCMRRAQHLENRSLLLNVDSATLPPSGTQTQCSRGAFHYHNLQAVDFLPRSLRHIDRLHVCFFNNMWV